MIILYNRELYYSKNEKMYIIEKKWLELGCSVPKGKENHISYTIILQSIPTDIYIYFIKKYLNNTQINSF